ncbi:hypothetical protein V7095_12660 [Bacillus thuringiensis]|nr:hypothetical protein [Bacillus thuringiensis]
MFYETVTGIEKLELCNQYYIAGVVKGMLAKVQQTTKKDEKVNEEAS